MFRSDYNVKMLIVYLFLCITMITTVYMTFHQISMDFQ